MEKIPKMARENTDDPAAGSVLPLGPSDTGLADHEIAQIEAEQISGNLNREQAQQFGDKILEAEHNTWLRQPAFVRAETEPDYEDDSTAEELKQSPERRFRVASLDSGRAGRIRCSKIPPPIFTQIFPLGSRLIKSPPLIKSLDFHYSTHSAKSQESRLEISGWGAMFYFYGHLC